MSSINNSRLASQSLIYHIQWSTMLNLNNGRKRDIVEQMGTTSSLRQFFSEHILADLLASLEIFHLGKVGMMGFELQNSLLQRRSVSGASSIILAFTLSPSIHFHKDNIVVDFKSSLSILKLHIRSLDFIQLYFYNYQKNDSKID